MACLTSMWHVQRQSAQIVTLLNGHHGLPALLTVDLGLKPAAAALRVGESAITALKLLEQGRGIIGSSLQDMRSDVEDLGKNYPDLAERYRSLQTELDRSKTTNTICKDSERSVNRRHAAARDFTELTAEIRRLPGYETFMLPPSDNEIYKASECGPIVVINISRLRCDALLISDSRVQALPLTSLDWKELKY